jgi:hypothetical protein
MKDDRQYWFPAKRFGWGWGPPTKWQGWAVLVGWLAIIGTAAARLLPVHWVGFLVINLLMVLLLLIICYWKGEPPGWRWGDGP